MERIVSMCGSASQVNPADSSTSFKMPSLSSERTDYCVRNICGNLLFIFLLNLVPLSFLVLKFHLVRDRYSSKSHTESMARCLTPFLSVFHKAINLLPANTQIREIQVFLESVLEEKAGRKRFDQVLKSLLQAEFLRVRLLVNSFHFLLKLYSVFLR